MAPREPTRAQLSSKLAYQANVPAFLQKLQNKMNGIPDDDDAYDDDADPEFEHVGGGRAPIPRRPAIPERPADDPGSADDDDFADEKPQVVVLKAGKHLTEREAENIRRAEKGLPPLPEPKTGEPSAESKEGSSSKEKAASSLKSGSQGLSFSSSSSATAFKGKKRKAVGQLDDLKAQIDDKSKDAKDSKEKSSKTSSKKAKKTSKTLLSFGDDT